MSILPLVLLAVPAFAQRVEVAPARAAGGGAPAAAAVSAVPAGLAAPAFAPALSAAAASGVAAPLAAAAAAPAALAPSAITAIDPASLPSAGKHYTGDEWAKLTAAAPDDGARAVLRTMHNGSSAQLSVKLANGESLNGSFLGIAGDKLAFKSGGKLVGLDMSSRDILEVRRMADVWFDGGTLRPEEVVVHSKPAAVADPFKDLAAYKGRYLEIDVREHDDPKRWTAQTFEGRLRKADGQEVELDGPKGVASMSKEFHVIEAVRERVPHYDSKNQVSSLSDVNAHIPAGALVEVEILKKPAAKGLFRGVRSDPAGDYVLLEVPNADGSTTMRAYRDALAVKTQGYAKGGLMAGSATVYAPAAAK